MRKGTLLSVFILFLFSCKNSNNNDIERIADDFCNCCDINLKSSDDIKTKRIKSNECLNILFQEIEKKTEDSTARNLLFLDIKKLISEKCPDCLEKSTAKVDKHGIISEAIKKNPQLCKEFFKDGDYFLVGTNQNIVITRKGSKNIVKYLDTGNESVFEIVWIDDCSYYLLLKNTNFSQETNFVGDTMLVKVLDIKGDTVHYDINIKSATYPQIMRRGSN